MQPIGILGGTFDPIHKGHVSIANQACELLSLQSISVVPVNIPPHKYMPIAGTEHRLNMINAIINQYDIMSLDSRELDRNEISYTIDTLRSFREDYKKHSLCLLMGRDAFNQIDSWHQWEALLNYAHIVVAERQAQETTLSRTLHHWIRKHVTDNVKTIRESLFGHIYFMQTTLIDISSSLIRESIKAGKKLDDYLFPETVDYINQHQLYQGKE